MSYKITSTFEDEDLQRVNSICAINNNMSERTAIQIAIEIADYLFNKQSEGYTLLLQKDENIEEFVLPM